MSGYTDGPWVAEGKGIRMLVRHVPSGGLIVATRHRLGGSENEDVMRLIAAAPELLRLLLGVQEMNPPLPMGMSEDIDAAIAKATGATP